MVKGEAGQGLRAHAGCSGAHPWCQLHSEGLVTALTFNLWLKNFLPVKVKGWRKEWAAQPIPAQ